MSSANLDTDLMRSVVAAMPAGPLSSLRAKATDLLVGVGLPTVGDEDWKYTNLADAVALSNDWLASASEHSVTPGGSDSHDIDVIRGSIDAHWIVLRDGSVDGSTPAIDGVAISRLEDSVPDVNPDDQPMTLFNAALLRDGLHISVNANTALDKPIGLVFIDSPSTIVSQTRVTIETGENAALQFVEVLRSADEGRQFTNSVLNIDAGAGSRVDHVRIQARNSAHTGVSRIFAKLDRDAQYHHNNFDFGGALTRTDTVAEIAGPGADISMNGLYLSSGDQHIDNHTCVSHNVGPARSREEYRGILTGQSQCVFNGKVIVAEGADGTDSGQTNHNLLLSDRAEIDTKPELEIYADDVKCAHGATVGQLDESALFYLRSRGIEPDDAKQMITRAFAAESLGALTVEACRGYLETLLDQRLEALVGSIDD